MRKDRTQETRERVDRAVGMIQSERAFAGAAVRKGEGLDWVVRFQTGLGMPLDIRIPGAVAERTDSHVLDFIRTALAHVLPSHKDHSASAPARPPRAQAPDPAYTCPHCGHAHTPETLIRLNTGYLRCAECSRSFPVAESQVENGRT